MEAFSQLLAGLGSALTINHIVACFAGVLVGTIAGVLPGIGPVGAMALLLPFSFGMEPGSSLIMLAGIYYGAMYGGSTTSILLNVPGEAASMVTAIDGYQMAKKGRAGAALAVSAIGSFIAGTIGVVLLMFFAPPLAEFALKFGPQEYLAIAVLGMLMLSNLTGESFIKAGLMFVLGMMISAVGVDQLMGVNRLSFGVLELSRGIDLIPFVMGLFGMAEVFSVIVEPYDVGELMKVKFRDLYPRKEEIKRSIKPILRGSIIGFPIGLIPGPAAIISSLVSYRVERSVSKHKDEFGNGAIEGVAGPESANNAASTGAMVPLLALGIPFAPATAVLLGGFMLQGVAPGPTFMINHSDLFWLIVASMYIGNVMLLILNLPLVGVFASVTKIRPEILMPVVTAIMLVGTYSVNNSFFDLLLLIIFGLIGYILKCIHISSAPLVVGFVLGSVFERGLRQSMIIASGNILSIFMRPIAGTLFALSTVTLIWIIFGQIKKNHKISLNEED